MSTVKRGGSVIVAKRVSSIMHRYPLVKEQIRWSNLRTEKKLIVSTVQ